MKRIITFSQEPPIELSSINLSSMVGAVLNDTRHLLMPRYIYGKNPTHLSKTFKSLNGMFLDTDYGGDFTEAPQLRAFLRDKEAYYFTCQKEAFLWLLHEG